MNRLIEMKTQSKIMITTKTLRSLLGVGLLCGAGLAVQAANPVSFSIDMTSQPTAAQVYLRGSFNNWGNPDVTVNGLLLTNDPAGPTPHVYSGTLDITDSPGTLEQCKFFYNPGGTWEDCIANRQFILAGGAQTLPLTSWCVSDWPVPNNDVKFQLDMSAQVLLGTFDPDTGYVAVSGNFNGWSESTHFTNDPSAPGLAKNIYSQTLQIAGFPGSYPGDYKFRAPIGNTYESINNRPSFQLVGGPQVLPLVYWNNNTVCDLLLQDTTVTFTLQLTNGTIATDGTVFVSPASSKVFFNSAFLPWQLWDTLLPEMINIPGTDLYTNTFVIPKGNPVGATFKFSIGGADNENGMETNHVQYVRTLGSTYTMPVCHFGTNYNSTLVEPSFGNLAIGARSGSTVPITWLGRQCVTLQTKSSLSGGLWTDLPATDGTSATNWPVGSTPQFFRLQKAP
jgi:hypothetical protein